MAAKHDLRGNVCTLKQWGGGGMAGAGGGRGEGGERGESCDSGESTCNETITIWVQCT